MQLPSDPFMLLSMVNMLLRDKYPTLEELCATEGIDADALKNTLAAAGFEYMPTINQFR